MSKFFKALEQAERERALREQALKPAAGAGEDQEGPAAWGTPAVRLHSAPWPDPVPQQERHVPPAERADRVTPEPLDGVDEHLVSLVAPTSFEAEQYRALRHTVEQMHKAGGLSIVAVSSPAAGDGKTTTAINLAATLGQAPETRVLLMEADLRRPSLTVRSQLGLHSSGGPGLVDAVLDPALGLDDVVQCHPRFNLSVLPAGWRPTAPYEALRSPRVGELLDEARQRYDYVIVDTPPLLVVPDCRLIGKWVDGFLVVVAAHRTPRKLVEEALNVLDPEKVIGIVFNGDDHPFSGYYGYYYAYSQSPDRSRPGGWGRMVRKVGASIWPANFRVCAGRDSHRRGSAGRNP